MFFPFRGRQVRVVEQKVARFSVYETPNGPPLESFETESEMAQWLGVTRQAVYAAFNRFCDLNERKIKKDGKAYFVKRVFDKGPVTNPWTEEATPTPKKQHAISVKIISSTSTKIYSSVSEATNDLGINSRTIHEALKSGRNSFTRRSDGEKFQVEKVEKPPPSPLPPKPIPQPRTKAPIPQPRTKAPIPQPRTMAPIPQPRTMAPIPQPRTKEAAEKPPLTDEQRKRQYYQEIKKEEHERAVRRHENWQKLRLKNWKWFLDPDVNIELEETKMVLFNPDTGVDIPVENYKDITEYFNSRGYLSFFLDEARFNSTLKQGRCHFIASAHTYETEEWIRLIYIKDPVYGG